MVMVLERGARRRVEHGEMERVAVSVIGRNRDLEGEAYGRALRTDARELRLAIRAGAAAEEALEVQLVVADVVRSVVTDAEAVRTGLRGRQIGLNGALEHAPERAVPAAGRR